MRDSLNFVIYVQIRDDYDDVSANDDDGLLILVQWSKIYVRICLFVENSDAEI